MAFDDTKTTEDGDGTVDSDEQVSADEWNAMVADQKSRVLFGTLAERPAAGDVPNGTPYLVTDLANDGGVITKVVDGSWQIQQIGDETNRPDVVAGSGDFDSVSTEQIYAGNIKTGEVSFSPPGPSSNDGWDDSNGEIESVSFSDPFESQPQVLMAIDGDSTVNTGFDVFPESISTGGFTAVIANYSTQDLDGESISADWVAISE